MPEPRHEDGADDDATHEDACKAGGASEHGHSVASRLQRVALLYACEVESQALVFGTQAARLLPLGLHDRDPGEGDAHDHEHGPEEPRRKDQADHVAPSFLGQTHRPIMPAQTPLCTYGRDHASP